MKKLSLIFSFILVATTLQAQYDDVFSSWSSMINFDAEKAKLIKKAGYKSLSLVAYEPDADDTASTITNEGVKKFDENGRLVLTSSIDEPTPNMYTAYTYDEKGRVSKYEGVYNKQKQKSETWEFEYDKKKGFKNIKYTGSEVAKWDELKSQLVMVTAMDTQYYSLNKKLMLDKYVKVYREKNFAPGFYHSDTAYYTYDKKGNLSSYKMVELNKFGDTTKLETGSYTYNKKNVLTSAVVKKYDMEKSRTFPSTEENHTFAISKKTGRLINYSKTVKENYSDGGEMRTDTYFIDELYTYGENGLEIRKSVSNNPGVVRLYQYRYAK